MTDEEYGAAIKAAYADAENRFIECLESWKQRREICKCKDGEDSKGRWVKVCCIHCAFPRPEFHDFKPIFSKSLRHEMWLRNPFFEQRVICS